MAGRALLSCAPPAVDDGRSAAFVTAETLRDIEGGFAASHVFVGIVASEAGKFSALAKASAGHQPDRLKSDRDWIIDLRRLRGSPRFGQSMTASTNFDRCLRGQSSCVEDGFPDLVRRMRRARKLHMSLSGPVTSLASNSRRHLRKVRASIDIRRQSCGV